MTAYFIFKNYVVSCILILVMSYGLIPVHEAGHFITAKYFGIPVIDAYFFLYFDNNTWQNAHVTIGGNYTYKVVTVNTIENGTIVLSVASSYNYVNLMRFMGFGLAQIVCLFLFWYACFSLSPWLEVAVMTGMIVNYSGSGADLLRSGFSSDTLMLLLIPFYVLWVIGLIYILLKIREVEKQNTYFYAV